MYGEAAKGPNREEDVRGQDLRGARLRVRLRTLLRHAATQYSQVACSAAPLDGSLHCDTAEHSQASIWPFHHAACSIMAVFPAPVYNYKPTAHRVPTIYRVTGSM